MAQHEMTVDPYRIGVHFPLAREDRGRGLAPCAQWLVHDVADYANKCPQDWNIGTPTRGAYFMGAMDGRELWFDFRPMQTQPHHIAVVITVQGLSAVTGLPVVEGVSLGRYDGPGRPTLEQYRVNCPVHGTPLGSHRMCDACCFRWPPHNYITNAAGARSIVEFWRDGWRTAQGEIRQFVLRAAEEGLGVAQQMLGSARTLAIDIAVFRSVNPKPEPVRDRPAYRGGVILCAGGSKGIGGGGFRSGSGRLGCSDREDGPLRESFLTGDSGDGDTFDDVEIAHARIGVPSRVEVAAGRQVDQEIHEDPHDLAYWHTDPVALFTLFPTDEAWVREVTRNGPTTRVVKSGAFDGIRTAG